MNVDFKSRLKFAGLQFIATFAVLMAVNVICRFAGHEPSIFKLGNPIVITLIVSSIIPAIRLIRGK